jgi:hypothetical protein
MSRIVWLIAVAGLSSIACSGSGNTDTTQPTPEPDDRPAASESSTEGQGEPGAAYFSEGPDGLVLESRGVDNNASLFRCSRSCASVCSDCLYEACLAGGIAPELCRGSRDDCSQGCSTCVDIPGQRACYAPCLKGEPTCFIELGLTLDQDPPRPDVLPGRDETMGDEVRPDDDSQPASDGASSESSSSSSSSSSGNGNSGRPAN